MIPFSAQAKQLQPGIYEHYKKNLYQVIEVVHHSETEEELVLYKRLDDGGMWVRPLTMFLENVEVDGVVRPRFQYLGE